MENIIQTGSHAPSPEPCPLSEESCESFCTHGFTPSEKENGALSTPIVLAATFSHPELGLSTGFDYSRGLNPTRLELERTVATLEKCRYALGFSSGMAAISTWVKQFLPGNHILVSEDLYGGTWRLFSVYERYGIQFEYIDTSDIEKVKKAMRKETKAIFIETPSNPMMRITDIAACADVIHTNGGKLCVDNTFLSPYLQNPAVFGADQIIHSGTKFLGGHHDSIAGFLAYNSQQDDEFFRLQAMSEGAALSPFDSWLILRGIKTLAVRMEKSCSNALYLAQKLKEFPLVEQVFYPGFATGKSLEIQKKQAKGFGAMISFYVKDASKIPQILKRLKEIQFAESLGGVQSLITYPITQTHNSIPARLREKTGVNEKLLRLSIGIENPEELLEDLAQAIAE